MINSVHVGRYLAGLIAVFAIGLGLVAMHQLSVDHTMVSATTMSMEQPAAQAAHHGQAAEHDHYGPDQHAEARCTGGHCAGHGGMTECLAVVILLALAVLLGLPGCRRWWYAPALLAVHRRMFAPAALHRPPPLTLTELAISRT